MADEEYIKRIIKREREARKEAERILEEKSLELYRKNEELKELNESLEIQVEQRTKEIQTREDQLRMMFENNPLPMMVYSVQSLRILDVNETSIKHYGYSKDEFTSMAISDLHPEKDLHRLSKHIQAVKHGTITIRDWKHQTKKGNLIEVEISGSSIKYQNKNARLVMIKDITKSKRIQEEIKRNEEKYRNIMENMELGLIEVDTNGIIKNAYPKFCELSGYTTTELIGKNAENVLLPKKYKELLNRESKNRKKGISNVYEVEMIKKDGSTVWVIISGAPFYDQNGRMIGSVGIHLDISGRKKIEKELTLAKEIAEKSVQTRELFMANMSHEIRTPMNAIIGMSDLLIKSNLSNKQTDYASAINTSADNLLVIINDILDFSKIESGNLSIEPINESLTKILNNSIKTISLKAEEKGIELNSRFDQLDNYLFDPIRLGQILINLIGNAVKFTSEGKIMVRCNKKPINDNYDEIHFSIRDTGIGIAKDKVEAVFRSFNQEEESTTRDYGGTGLGLPISKKLVELMGGELTVKSEKGKGSTFSFSIKLEKAPAPELVKENANSTKSNIDGLSILLVEDHEINRFMAQTMLASWNCNIDIANNGLEALEKVRDKKYDIILMDVRMPIMSGIEATNIIRKKLKIDVPIIALTANAIVGDNEKCFQAGMNDYVSKPYKQDELLAVIKKYKPENKKSQNQKSDSNTPENWIDLSRLISSTDNNHNFIQKMIALFIDDTPKQIESLSNALAYEDWSQISKVAHKIKPSIDYVSVITLQKQVRLIESTEDQEKLKIETESFIIRLQELISQLQDQ